MPHANRSLLAAGAMLAALLTSTTCNAQDGTSPLGGQPPPGSSASVKDFDYQIKYQRAFEARDRLHQRDFDIAIVNAGGLTHTSVSLRDALLAIQRPFIEVHLSDPARREAFRQVNYLHDIALESIVGQGARGYHLALESIARRFGGAHA